jgi:hypothetical protein
MFGTGRLRLVDGMAWGETFGEATGELDLEGTGMRIHRIDMTKGPGRVLGDARIGWDGTYAFEAAGDGIAVEDLDTFQVESAPLSGRLEFRAFGAGAFEAPSYSFRGTIADLFLGDQGVGLVQGQIRVEGRNLLLDRVAVNSGLHDVVGRGTIAMSDAYDSALFMRFTQSSRDPYL